MSDRVKQITVKKGSSKYEPSRSLWLTIPSSRRKTRRRGFAGSNVKYFFLSYPSGQLMFTAGEFPYIWNDEKRSLSVVWKGEWEDVRSGKESYKEIPVCITFHRPIDYSKVKKMLVVS